MTTEDPMPTKLYACAVCGLRTERRWCSTACHRLDEPSAYERDDE
jgi:hypothetical protein